MNLSPQSQTSIEEVAEEADQAVDLALATAKSIHQIAKLMRSCQTGRELKRFYGHLKIHCVFVGDYVIRIRSMLGLGNGLIDRVLQIFESLIATQEGTCLDTRPYPWQRALNRAWAELQDQPPDARLQFARRCLNTKVSPGQTTLKASCEAFEMWEEDVDTQCPEDGTVWSVGDDRPRTRGRPEPSYAVGSAAQMVFKALASSAKCQCKTMHEIDVRLRLGTYRTRDFDDRNDFDMFLASNKDWQEAHVQAVRDTRVRFPESREDIKPMMVKTLCHQVEKMRKMAAWRLELKVEKGQLFKLRSERSTVHIDKERPPVSLRHFISEGSRPLTEKTKRILAVLLSYTVLHLHGTPWLQSTWDSSQVLFFHTSSSKIPVRPFIQTKLSDECLDPNKEKPKCVISHNNHLLGAHQLGELSSNDRDGDDLNPDDIDPDDLDPDDVDHPVPVLVTLAVMLMELYFAAPVEVLARDRGIEFPKDTTTCKRSLDMALIFNEYKREIPQNSQFYHAIEKCLDHVTWQDDYGQKLEGQLLRVTIYQEVVRRLENELCDAFNFITIEELDKIAESVDVGSWGRTLQNQQAKVADRELAGPLFEGKYKVTNICQNFPQMVLQNPLLNLYSVAWKPSVLPMPSPGVTTPILGQQQLNPISQYVDARFYDDEKTSTAHSNTEVDSYVAWKSRYMHVYEKYIYPYLQDRPQLPVKIAVLDTGVDDTHTVFDTSQIKHKRNWTSKYTKAVHDGDGHGTFTASLIVDYAPDAELYVAKIADKIPCPPSVIAEAIRTAVDDWEVDIISMSFGYPTNQADDYRALEDALLYAHSKSVLMFAAASNGGANRDRAYPARDPHVICVHSTDAAGNRSRFSPTALAQDANVATVGEAVQSAWPVALCNLSVNPECVQVKSGTSYATPILVGIAAFLLQYARIHLPDLARELKRRSKMRNVLVRIAEKTQRSVSRDDYHYVALSLFADNLFGKEKQVIDVTLGELLRR